MTALTMLVKSSSYAVQAVPQGPQTALLLWAHYTGLVVWATAFLFMLAPVGRVLFRTTKASAHDVVWALVAGVAVMLLGYNLRWLFDVDSDAIRLGLSAFSILLGAQAFRLRLSYWRTPDA